MEKHQKKLIIIGTGFLIAAAIIGVIYSIVNWALYQMMMEIIIIFGSIYVISGIVNIRKRKYAIALFLLIIGSLAIITDIFLFTRQFIIIFSVEWYYGLIFVTIGITMILLSRYWQDIRKNLRRERSIPFTK